MLRFTWKYRKCVTKIYVMERWSHLRWVYFLDQKSNDGISIGLNESIAFRADGAGEFIAGFLNQILNLYLKIAQTLILTPQVSSIFSRQIISGLQ